MTGCRKNPKNFLGFKYIGKHEPKPTYVTRFGSFSWAKYEVSFECRFCGLRLTAEVMDEADMVNDYNFSEEKLQEIGEFGESAKDLMP